MVTKEVHWYLMTADNYHSRPQREELLVNSGYYKYHEIYHLLRFTNEKQKVEKAYQENLEMRSQGLWGKKKTGLCFTQPCLDLLKRGNPLNAEMA